MKFEGMVIELCSDFDDIHRVTCDLYKGHMGPHRATLYWGDEGGEEE